jgi:hypothetical protein
VDQEKRDRYALQAPITAEMVVAACGYDDLSHAMTHDTSRAVFFSIWALLTYEWADAMLSHAEDEKAKS